MGEVHSNRESHELELQVLKEFYKRNGNNIAVGLEMFKKPHQDILDKWTKGEISEKELLYSTDWDYEWGMIIIIIKILWTLRAIIRYHWSH